MKTCSKCGESKPLTEFSRDRRARSGYRPDCKTCVRRRQQPYERSEHGRRLQRERKRKQYAQRPETAKQRQQAHFKRSPEQRQAQHKVGKALQSGKLTRPDSCQHCGASPAPAVDGRSRITAHHADYSRPLDVEWLCRPCHAEADEERRALERVAA